MNGQRDAQEPHASGLRPLSIGIVHGDQATVPDPLLCAVLDHMLAKRRVRELWMVRDVFQRDAVTAWGKSAGIDVQFCSRYVLLTVAHRFDGIVALGVEDWLVRRLRDDGKIVWEPLRPKV